MIPWVHLDTARVPGGDELRLMQRGAEFSIMAGTNELMNSRVGGSEEALAVETIRRLGPRHAPRVLIGGYGMGFTLRAALAALGPDARVVVAELVPEILAWARGPMAALTAGCLDDPRVELVEGDVAASIDGSAASTSNAGASAAWDAILLDVDNGPDGLTRAANDRLYSPAGLARARAALKEVVEMPDHQADRVLRSIEQNRGELSNVLAKEIPVLAQFGVWAEIIEVVS